MTATHAAEMERHFRAGGAVADTAESLRRQIEAILMLSRIDDYTQDRIIEALADADEGRLFDLYNKVCEALSLSGTGLQESSGTPYRVEDLAHAADIAAIVGGDAADYLHLAPIVSHLMAASESSATPNRDCARLRHLIDDCLATNLGSVHD